MDKRPKREEKYVLLNQPRVDVDAEGGEERMWEIESKGGRRVGDRVV